MKSILIIANFASIHIYNFVKNTIDSEQCKVHGLSMSPISSIPNEYLDYYNSKGISLTEEATLSSDNNRTKIIKIFKQLKGMGIYDVLHIHYVKHLYAPGIFLLRKKYKRIVLTFWGSDFYRSSCITRAFTFPLLRVADKMSFITPNMRDDFMNKSLFHVGLRKKTTVLDYGNMLFPYIDSAKELIMKDKTGAYSSLGLLSDRITITIGYVGRPQMQQKEAVEAILHKINSTIIDNTQIVIPAYGMKEDTYYDLCKMLDESKVCYRIIPDFLGPNEVALLRSITDIFIHPQTTDAFSSSMQECFYANAVIINGEWLQYKDAQEAGSFFLQFKTFDDLPKILLDAVNNIDYYKQKSVVNKQIMMDLCSWDRWCSEWKKLYQ